MKLFEITLRIILGKTEYDPARHAKNIEFILKKTIASDPEIRAEYWNKIIEKGSSEKALKETFTKFN